MTFWTNKTVENVPQAKKTIFLGQESENYENNIPQFENFEKYIEEAPKQTVQNGSYAFPNKLMRFRNEATPIWG